VENITYLYCNFYWICFTYIIIELDNQNGWLDYEACRNATNRMGSLEMQDKCAYHLVASEGLNNIFYLFIGWIPAGGYAGFFELLWRRKHRETIRKMGKQFKGKWFSNFVVVAAIPVWLFMFIIFLAFIYNRIDCPHAIVATDKCWIPQKSLP
jgi:hypothetical protein